MIAFRTMDEYMVVHVCGYRSTIGKQACKNCSAGDYPANWTAYEPDIDERIEHIESFLKDLHG